MRFTWLFLLFILGSFPLAGQDRITTLQGDLIYCKIHIIDAEKIHYSLQDTTTSEPVYKPEVLQIKIPDVFMINFANGSREVFTQNLPDEKTNSSTTGKNYSTNTDYYALGEADAEELFDPSGAIAAGIAGIIPTAIVSLSSPEIRPSRVSDPELLSNAEYRRGYKKQAGSMKRKSAAIAYVASRATFIGMIILFDILE